MRANERTSERAKASNGRMECGTQNKTRECETLLARGRVDGEGAFGAMERGEGAASASAGDESESESVGYRSRVRRVALVGVAFVVGVACVALVFGFGRSRGGETFGDGGEARARAALGEGGGASIEAGAQALGAAHTQSEYECYLDAESRATSALGALGGALPSGCLNGSCSDVTESGIKISAVGEHIYVICMQCNKMRVPNDWGNKVTFVRGDFVDQCYKGGRDHWHKASMSHVHAMNDARERGFSTIAIIEEDAATVEPQSSERIFDIDQIVSMLRSNKQWHVARIGYRPYFFESQRMKKQDFRCPAACRCNAVARNACIIRDGTCDIRSSDFYLVRMQYAFPIQQMVQVGGSTIDMAALQRVKNQIYVVPQLSFQENLDATFEQQINMASRFRDLCFIPGATPELGGKETAVKIDETAVKIDEATVDDQPEDQYESASQYTDADESSQDIPIVGAAEVFAATLPTSFLLGEPLKS